MQAAMAAGRVTSQELVRQYLARIALYEHTLHAALAISKDGPRRGRPTRPRAGAGAGAAVPCTAFPSRSRTTSRRRTCRRPAGRWRSTASSRPTRRRSPKNLRDAGAVIIAKTGMTELANWVAGDPTPMPSNYNAVGGFGFNPYDPRRDPRDRHLRRPAGARDRRLELGHRHGGQLLGGQCRHRNVGVDSEPVEPEHAGGHQADGGADQPIRRDSDHRRSGHARADGAGPSPMRRSCSARSKAPHPIRATRRPIDARCAPAGTRRGDYTRSLRADGLKGARIGIPRAFYYDRVDAARRRRAARRLEHRAAALMAEAIDVLKQQGAIDRRSRRTFRAWSMPTPAQQLPALGHLFGRRRAQGQGCRLLGRFEVRHEARLQHVAGDARRRPRR